MNNLKKSIMSVAMAAITAASPILSSYVAYASDITVNDDGTVTQVSTSTDSSMSKADETKLLFIINFKPGNPMPLGAGRKGSFFTKKMKNLLFFYSLLKNPAY